MTFDAESQPDQGITSLDKDAIISYLLRDRLGLPHEYVSGFSMREGRLHEVKYVKQANGGFFVADLGVTNGRADRDLGAGLR